MRLSRQIRYRSISDHLNIKQSPRPGPTLTMSHVKSCVYFRSRSHSSHSRQKQMGPLNDCLRTHMEQRRKPGGSISPRWLLFHDTDEYLYPIDTNLTIPQALENHEDICCVLVSDMKGAAFRRGGSSWLGSSRIR